MRNTVLFLIFLPMTLACAGNLAQSVAPDLTQSHETRPSISSSSPLLWGLWEIEYSPESGVLDLVPLRTAEQVLNVTMFLQPPAGSLANISVSILDSSHLVSEGRLDVQTTLKHPFPSKRLRGFDVRGVVLGNETVTDPCNSEIAYRGSNDLELLNADGYTRWMNQPEYQIPGIIGYTPGALGTKALLPSATINGYRYFADAIDSTQSVYSYFASSLQYVANRGSMTPGTSISRDYYLRFPMSPLQVKFQYAIIAGWQKATSGGDNPTVLDFPISANTFEPVSISIVDSSTLYYEDSAKKGGDIDLTVSVVDWLAYFDTPPLSQAVKRVIVSSPTIDMPSGSYEIFDSADLTFSPTSAWNAESVHILIQDCAPSGVDNQEVLIQIEMDGYDYTNPFGINNLAWADPLTGYFIHKLNISPEFNDPPVVLDGVNGPADAFITDVSIYTIEATDEDSPVLTFEWSVKDPLTGALLFGPVPGTSPGEWQLDWAEVAKVGAVEIDCSVSDGANVAYAEPLIVDVGDLIFHADLNDTTQGDNSGWATTGFQGISKWTTTVGDDNILKGYGRKFAPFDQQYLMNSSDILVSPAIDIPDTIDRAIAVLSHSYDFEYDLMYEIGFDGANIKVTEAPTLPDYTDPETDIIAGKDYDGWLFDTAIDNQMAFASDQFKDVLNLSVFEIPAGLLGHSVYLGFAVATDYADPTAHRGWLIDDVQIRAMVEGENAPPVPGGGIEGEDRALLLEGYTDQYKVVGYDLENDPLSYEWTIREPGNGAILWGPVTGPDTGLIDISWTDAVSSGGTYEVHVSIYDGHNAGVPASPLSVMVQSVAFHADFSDTTTGDNAGWTAILESGATSWTTTVGSDSFLDGFGRKWGDFDESYQADSQGILLSPVVSIPSGLTSASIYVLHDFEFLPALDGGNIKVVLSPSTPAFSTTPEAVDGGYLYDVDLSGTVMDGQDAFGIGAGGGTLMLSRIDLASSTFGKQIRIGFAAASGTTWFNMRGWLIDDIVVATVP